MGEVDREVSENHGKVPGNMELDLENGLPVASEYALNDAKK